MLRLHCLNSEGALPFCCEAFFFFFVKLLFFCVCFFVRCVSPLVFLKQRRKKGEKIRMSAQISSPEACTVPNNSFEMSPGTEVPNNSLVFSSVPPIGTKISEELLADKALQVGFYQLISSPPSATNDMSQARDIFRLLDFGEKGQVPFRHISHVLDGDEDKMRFGFRHDASYLVNFQTFLEFVEYMASVKQRQ